MQKEKSNIPLFDTKQAMLSLRESGHDLKSAVGEVIDNSIQGNARKITIEFSEKEEQFDTMALGDDGDGMSPEILPLALGLGCSTRFNDRSHMGRFGVGATLGGISQARKLEYYSKTKKQKDWAYCVLDLDTLSPTDRHVVKPVLQKIPHDLLRLQPANQGTLVIWSNIDRKLSRGTKFQDALSDIKHYIGRTYRHYLHDGLKISVNGTPVDIYDPLLLLPTKLRPNEPMADILLDETFTWPAAGGTEQGEISVKVTLWPEVLRTHRGKGGADRNPLLKNLKPEKNLGVSITRARREIYFDVPARIIPGGATAPDRFWGMEIDFPPDLDELFAVRNIKKGAEPVDSLRNHIATLTKRAITIARKRIDATWNKNDAKKSVGRRPHQDAEAAAAVGSRWAPKNRAGENKTPDEQEIAIAALVNKVTQSTPGSSNSSVRKELETVPIVLLDDSWPGKEFMHVEHIAPTKSVITLNQSHPFLEQIYRPLSVALDVLIKGEEDQALNTDQMKLIIDGIRLLVMSYVKAECENYDDHGEFYDDLRCRWGLHLANFITSRLKGKKVDQ